MSAATLPTVAAAQAAPVVAATAVAAQTVPAVAAPGVAAPLVTTMAGQPVTYLSSQPQVTYAQSPVTLPTATSYVYNYAAPMQTVVVGATPYFPGSVQAAWDNHFEAFGKQDLDKIMLDYDETSVARVYNNADGKKDEFKGLAAIRGMFEQLFKDLPDLKTLEAPVIDVDAAGNQVFLVWKCPGCGFEAATDTFIFGPDFKIKRQNIVVQKKEKKEKKDVVKKTKKGCW